MNNKPSFNLRLPQHPSKYWHRLPLTILGLGAILIFCLVIPIRAQQLPGTVIYLDFDGHTEYGYPYGNQFINLTVPPFDDADPLSDRQEIERNIVEDFSSFDVEVTTVEPSGIEDGYYGQGQKRIRVVIGGEAVSSGYPRSVLGVSTDPTISNVVFAFQAGRNSKQIAKTASHELAHAFSFSIASGLSHYTTQAHHDQTQYPNQMPILGSYLSHAYRDVWFTHPHVLVGLEVGTGNEIWDAQDDLYVLTKVLDLRRDDHSGIANLATRLRQVSAPAGSTKVQAQGIIEMSPGNYTSMCPPQSPGTIPARIMWCWLNPLFFSTFDDVFIFEAGWGSGGSQYLYVRADTINETSPAQGAANVDTDLELWYLNTNTGRWQHITSVAKNTTDLWAQLVYQSMPRTTGAGTYAVVVKSAGGYSDIGQYTVSVRGENVQEIEGLWHSQFLVERFYTLLERLENLEAQGNLVDFVNVMLEEQMMYQPDEIEIEVLADIMHESLEQAVVTDVFAHLFTEQIWAEIDQDTRIEIEARFVDAIKRLIE